MIKARGEARRISLIILSLTFFGALLRLYKLGVPLNGDEIPAFTWFTLIHWETLLFSYYDPNQHTLFVILARLFMSSLGENEVTFRLPVFIAGILSVPLIYNVCSDYLRSRQTGLIAALLLSVSFYPIYYSQHGRSYSLTIFLALSIILVTTKLSNNTRLWFWGTLLPLLGFFLILALPSNLYFIFATPVFFLIFSRQNKNGYRETLKCFFKREFFPFLVMFLLVFLYIFKIFPDIQRAIGIANSFGYHNGGNEISLTKLYHVFKYLLEPWGLWIYPFLLFGILQLKKQGRLSGLIIFFLVPLILIFAQGIIGPPRVYLFWHPLFLIICSAGVVNVFALIKGFKVQNKIVLAVLIITILLLGPAFRLEAYYRNQENLRGGITIAEAQKFSRSIERDDKHNRLFFVKSEILNRYIGSRIF